MENISNLSDLFNVLLNGMLTVFLVLFLVYFLGKALIYFFDSESTVENNDYQTNKSIEESLKEKIKDISGGNAKIINIRKLE